MEELTDIANKGMKKLSKEAPELFARMVDVMEAYNMNKAGTLEAVQELENALRDYLYDHRKVVED